MISHLVLLDFLCHSFRRLVQFPSSSSFESHPRMLFPPPITSCSISSMFQTSRLGACEIRSVEPGPDSGFQARRPIWTPGLSLHVHVPNQISMSSAYGNCFSDRGPISGTIPLPPLGQTKWISRGAAQLPRLPDRVFDLTQNSRDRIGYNHSLSHMLLPISRQDP